MGARLDYEVSRDKDRTPIEIPIDDLEIDEDENHDAVST